MRCLECQTIHTYPRSCFTSMHNKPVDPLFKISRDLKFELWFSEERHSILGIPIALLYINNIIISIVNDIFNIINNTVKYTVNHIVNYIV